MFGVGATSHDSAGNRCPKSGTVPPKTACSSTQPGRLRTGSYAIFNIAILQKERHPVYSVE